MSVVGDSVDTEVGAETMVMETEIGDAVEDGGAAKLLVSTRIELPPQPFECGRKPARRASKGLSTTADVSGDHSNSGQPVVVNLGESAGTRGATSAPISGGQADRANQHWPAAAGDGGLLTTDTQSRGAAIATNHPNTRRTSHGVA